VVSGISFPAFVKALCIDSIRERGPVIFEYCLNGETVGAIVITHGTPVFWKCFFARHPLVALRFIFSKFYSYFINGKEKTEIKAPLISQDHKREHNLLWNSKSIEIARCLLVTVNPSFRGRNIATNLYLATFTQLKSQGVKTLLARISSSNYSSLSLHRSIDFRLNKIGNFWQAVKDIA
jgi:GNAT superfamily N-acetyltransferase